MHQLVHGRPHPARFHVRGFNEEGTTTTPFDMVVLNEMSRFHLAALAVKQSSLPAERIAELVAVLDAHEADAGRTRGSISRIRRRSATGGGATEARSGERRGKLVRGGGALAGLTASP